MQEQRKQKFVRDLVKRLLKQNAKIIDGDEPTPTEGGSDGFVRSGTSWLDRLKKPQKRQ